MLRLKDWETAPEGGFEPTPAVPLKVLVVEADPVSRGSLKRAIQLFGYECRTARDGEEAWEMHQEEHADVILSDWQLARMEGVELCRRTRVSDEEGRYTYFIFMTSFGDKEHFLRGMQAGADDYHTKPIDLDELRARLASAGRVVALYRRLGEKNKMLRKDSQTSFREARVDALTGVANRLRMSEDFAVLWSRVERYGHRFSIAIADIDAFKDYNDHFGHVAGDEVLKRVAETVRDQLRQGDSLYRYGGEEFVIVLPEQSLAEAVLAMERVRSAVEKLAIPSARPERMVTASFGVAELDRSVDGSVEDWLRRADAALYRAKARGRNRVETDPTA